MLRLGTMLVCVVDSRCGVHSVDSEIMLAFGEVAVPAHHIEYRRIWASAVGRSG